jgi:hypothetical protein
MRVVAFVFALAAACAAAAAADAIKGDWEELKGKHFIVHYVSSKKGGASDSESFAKKTLRKAESCYKSAAQELGYERRSDFWTWDNRVKIYIYAKSEAFTKGTNQPKWSKGMADYTNKRILGFQAENEKYFLEGILPHEIGHLVFRDFIGFRSDVPLWLDEGVAQWQEKEKRKIARLAARELGKKKQLLSLKDLMEIDQERLRKSKVKNAVRNFYIQSAALVDMMISKYGTGPFTKFCRALRDGKGVGGSLKAAYPDSLKTIGGLQKEFLEYVAEDKK